MNARQQQQSMTEALAVFKRLLAAGVAYDEAHAEVTDAFHFDESEARQLRSLHPRPTARPYRNGLPLH